MDLVAGVKEKLTYFRIKELKDVLTQLGLSKQGKKQDLVDRILSIISDEQVSKMWAKKNAVGKEQVAKLVDDTYRKMQISGATDLASKGQAVSDSSNVKVKAEVEESFQIQSATKIRCLCGSTLETEDLIKCDDAKCKVWQHISCVIIPEKPMEGIPPVPDKFYCELCRLSRADPFWVSVSHPLLPVKLIITSIPTDGTNPVQCVEKSFQLTRADRDMVSKQEFDVEAWCMLLNDKVPFRMQWPQYTDLAINGLPVRTTNRPGSQLLGANGRDDGPIITPHTKDGINKISLTVCDPRIFCLGVRIVRRRSLQQILNLIPKEPDGEPFEDALARVCRCVGGGNAADNADSDSDLEVVSDTFSINLRCPRSGTHQQRWKEKPKTEAIGNAESVTNKLSGIHIGESTAIWKPKSYGTVSGGATVTEVESTPVGGGSLSNISRANMLEKFTVDNSTYAHARIRASFYPKFENEKSDQETRSRMIELVSKGLATLEVSLKHSGSLFMYAGHEGGAYAKNSFGNIYTAVGVFVLGRMFCEAWGTEALKKQAEFNNFLEKNHMCISMELVTAVLGDHGQRPHEDYVVVTAVTELGNGKPKFYSTPEIIAFCRKWRLPTNHVWLFSTRKSASSFFAAYDALYEEGTATSVCMALDEIADVSVPASKDHVKGQGEILEGLVARLVSHESSNHIEKILKEFPPPPADGAALDFGPSLREICAANRSDEKQQVKALLESVGSSFCPDYSDWSGTDAADVHSRNADKSVLPKFLQAHPADYSTKKLQEIIRLMREKRLPAAFKCYHNFHKVDATSNNNLFYKMVIHVHSDSAFRRYQNEMRKQPGLWPLYRGFFVDINLFKADKEKVTEISKDNSINESGSSSTEKDDFADEDANLMVKLKFLTYKLRTFLIRNGLSILFKEGTGAYKAYYLRQMKKWGISPGKQRELSKMLDEWALYITRKCGKRQLSSSIYLSEAEPFLEQFAKRCPQNQALIGSAGNLVRTEDFLAIVEGGQDEEGDLVSERDITPSGPNISVRDTVPKDEGMIVFFPALYVNFEHDPSAPLVKQVFLHPASATRIVLPDGRYMAYKEQGVSADRARFSIIAPHTFLSSRLAGIPGVKDSLLEEFGIRLLTYDLPGFGESDPHPKRSLESSAIDMSFLADALGVDKFWVIGYSSGSKHAWAALRYIPDRLAGAAMFAPMVNPYDLLMTNEERRRTWNKWTRKRKLMYFLARRFPRLLSFFYQRSFLSGKHGQIDRWLSLSLGSRDKALMEDPIYEEFWQRDVEESIRQGNAKPFVEEAALQVSNWGFSLLDLRLQKRKLNRNVLNWLKAMFTETQEYTGFLGPIHIWHCNC